MKKIDFNEEWILLKQGKTEMHVTLPHDAMQEEGRTPEAASGSGCAFFNGGKYEYQKQFLVPQEWKGKKMTLFFEGVYPNATVFLNEKEAGGCRYGYTGFYVEAEGIRYGENNVIKVVADNENVPNSRWYSGAGIYRPVWLWVGNEEHIRPEGIRIRTLSVNPARILVETDIVGNGVIEIAIEYQGEIVAKAAGDKVEIEVPDAKLWSHETPELYKCHVTLKDGDEILDAQTVNFGIRTISWSAKGLLVNGKETLLQGGCIHHDNGILGARSYVKSEWRRIKRLKEWGFNAIRSAHNPACNAMLDACDALGMYVVDEAWDMWYEPKNAADYANEFMENYEDDVKAMVAKDYNHPSVLMYSIGNEVTEPAKPEGVKMAEKLVELFHGLDDTRPVTAGINLMILLMKSMELAKKEEAAQHEDTAAGSMQKDENPFHIDEVNSTAYNAMISQMGEHMNQAAAKKEADEVTSPVLDLLDIAGYNYASSRYPLEAVEHPERIVVGSETFPQSLSKNWEMVKEYPYLVGDFMWTAWDYLGEVGIGTWSYESDAASFYKKYPWILAEAGAIDILGNDNAEAGLAAAVWKSKKEPYIGVVPVNHPCVEAARSIWRGSNARPDWSYLGCEGNEAEIEVYSPADQAELFINGKSLGRKKLTECKAVFKTAYEPGTVKAVVYASDGSVYGENKLTSADKKTMISIILEEEAVIGEILYLNINITGSNGMVECNRDEKLGIAVEGGELLAFGSANPRTEEDFLSGSYTTYYGRSQAVVRVRKPELCIAVSGEKLGTVHKKIAAKRAE